jgi:uncharacterized integral membrane protein
MIRLAVAVSLTFLLVAFAMSNTHQVVLSFVIGRPVQVRLIFLMMSSFLGGMLFSGLLMMALKLRTRGGGASKSGPPQAAKTDIIEG